MFTLIRSFGFRKALQREATTLTIALAIAELFFHFHSFVLECVAFMATWYVLSWAVTFVIERWPRPKLREAAGAEETASQSDGRKA